MMNIKQHQLATLGSLIISSMCASAAIPVVPQNYVEEPDIVFSIGEPKKLTPPPVAEVAPPQVTQVEVWEIKQNSYLQDILKEWSDRAGWSFVWGLDKRTDFQLNAAHSYKGDFKTVVKMLFDSMPPNIHLEVELGTTNNPPLLFIKKEERNK